MLKELLSGVSFGLAKDWKVNECERAILYDQDGYALFAKNEENVGKHISELVSPKYRELILQRFKETIRKNKTIAFCTENYRLKFIRCMGGVLTLAQRKKKRIYIQRDISSFVCALSLMLDYFNIVNIGII